MGNQPGQLNLRATRQRASELGALIDELLATLRFAPHTMRWNDLVDKMAVMNVQLQQLKEEVRPVAHHYALHPKSVSVQNAGTLPIMLASMLYPEQQALCDTEVARVAGDLEHWKAALDGLCGGDPGAGGVGAGGAGGAGGVGGVGGGRARKAARRRGAGAGLTTTAMRGSTAGTSAVTPLDDAERALLDIASFGGV